MLFIVYVKVFMDVEVFIVRVDFGGVILGVI